MSRVYNFSAGPAVLPEEVLKEAAAEMLDYKGTGMSVMEMSHRSKAFETIITEAEADLRELMGIPDNYKVLFLQGGAHLQFSAIPQNLMKQIISLPASGQRKHGKKPRNTVRPTPLHPVKIRPSAIFRTALIFRSTRMQIMSIFVRITRFMEPSSMNCRIPRVRP